ncbi:ATP-binding protein [Vibrio sp. SCSIO 43136]|uniref:ATP-binding protein n=1 Tax=Vibrio sp. SCSIO 43136 TaxID=2819101 RepID=UPI002075BE81|nr:ATP-binding protein [Vibrio sp. SCSIO 43136]USD66896.1 response regulator [Vibrio sp. SCSIO 43136]
MSGSIERKLRREVLSRKEAERLLEEKSRALYETNQQLEVALGELEQASLGQLKELEFKKQLDKLLIHYGQQLLSRELDNIVVSEITNQLKQLPLLDDIAIELNSHPAIKSTNCLRVSSLPMADINQLTLTIELSVDKHSFGQIIALGDINDEHVLTNGLTMVADMLKGALQRQIILHQHVESRQRAEISERSTREFLAMINHELRTPLNGLLGGIELLQDTALSPQQNLLVNTVNRSGEFLRVIINDLLDFSKLNAGMFELLPTTFSTAELKQTLQSIFGHKCAEKGLRFGISIAKEVPDYLIGDRERISQVLVNIIGNAVKFTEQGKVDTTFAWLDEQLVVTISDTGQGIADTESLFQPFTQADRSVNRQHEGTGLGLAICDRLVSLMEGQIVLDTQVGKGTTFTIHLPLSIGSKIVDLPNQQSSDNIELSELKVLVVEDIKINQLVIQQMLSKLMLTPEICENGQEALDTLEQRSFDLILMDCRMPVMDGLQATKLLREQGYSKPIVALTAGTTSMEREECINAGMDDILSKPYRSSELVDILRRWCPQN